MYFHSLLLLSFFTEHLIVEFKLTSWLDLVYIMNCASSPRLSGRIIVLWVSAGQLGIHILKVFLESVYFLMAVSDCQLINLLLGFSDFLFQF